MRNEKVSSVVRALKLAEANGKIGKLQHDLETAQATIRRLRVEIDQIKSDHEDHVKDVKKISLKRILELEAKVVKLQTENQDLVGLQERTADELTRTQFRS